MSQPPLEPTSTEPSSTESANISDQQQAIQDSSLREVQVAQAGRDVHQHQEIHHHYGNDDKAAAEPIYRENAEKILLQQMKAEVSDRLATSLHSAAFITLDKEKQSTQVKRDWDAEIKVGQQQSTPVEAGTVIVDVFDQPSISGKLLILGAPGSGKTTTLLELAEALVHRTETRPDSAVPVLRPLASWKNGQTIEQWFIKELKDRYGVRRALTQQLLNNRKILPLLDGLDEVNSEWHADCIEAINQFYDKYRFEHFVVCCRLAEYQNSQTKLQLNGAIYLRPLTSEQIRSYLLSAEHPEVWKDIESDPALMKLAKSPLLLSILTAARQTISLQAWRQLSTSQEQRQYLVTAYVQHMLARTSTHQWYPNGQAPTSAQTKEWLSYIAKQLNRHSQSEFAIERIQPDWLTTPHQRRLYRSTTGLLVGATIGIVGGFIFQVYQGTIAFLVEGLGRSLTSALLSGLGIAFANGVVLGLMGLLIYRLSNRPFKFFIYGSLMSALVGAVTTALEGGELSGGIVDGWLLGLFLALFAVFSLQRPATFIETLKWSKEKAFSGIFYGFIGGVVVLLLGAIYEGLDSGTGLSLLFLLVGLVAGGLMSGYNFLPEPTFVKTTLLSLCEKGIRHGLMGGLLFGLLVNIIILALFRFRPDQLEEFYTWENLSPVAHLAIVIPFYEVSFGFLGLVLGAFIYCGIGLSQQLLRSISRVVKQRQKPQWSRRRLAKGLTVGFAVGLCVSILALSTVLGSSPIGRLLFSLFAIALFGGTGGIIGAIIGGFRGPDIEARKIPNQGIRKSASNAAKITLLSSLSMSVVVTGLMFWNNGIIWSLDYGLKCGSVTLMLCSVALGGICMRHLALRFTLYRNGLAPWNYQRFLGHASNRMLIRQIGGRYQFIHDIFQQYFASL